MLRLNIQSEIVYKLNGTPTATMQHLSTAAFNQRLREVDNDVELIQEIIYITDSEVDSAIDSEFFDSDAYAST